MVTVIVHTNKAIICNKCYDNMPMLYTVFFTAVKMKILDEKKKIFFLFLLKT